MEVTKRAAFLRSLKLAAKSEKTESSSNFITQFEDPIQKYADAREDNDKFVSEKPIPKIKCPTELFSESPHYTLEREEDFPTVVAMLPNNNNSLDSLENPSSTNQKLITDVANTNPYPRCSTDKLDPVYFENPISTDQQLSDITNISPHPRGSNVYTVSYSKSRPTVLHLTRRKEKNYYISPIHSGESDVDDEDKDPNFNSSNEKAGPETNIEGEVEEENKSKKRKQRPETWYTKKAKQLRNSGEAYVSASKTKKEFSARKLRPPCGEKCRLKCSQKINETTRQEIFKNYWGLANIERQREFIVVHAQTIKPKYRYSSTQEYRSMNSAFYFKVGDTNIRVCKSFFKATLDINDRPIRTALRKKTETGFITSDMRGKHGKQPTVDPEIKESVRKFIDAIPRIESHYLRAQTTREFIEGGKSLADLYRDYKEDRERQQLPFANSVMFNRIFNGEFNISFYTPKKDQCDFCESFKNSDEEGKQKLNESYDLHLKEKELSRKEKEDDKNNSASGTYVAVYDLQAVMPVPRGQISSFYYKSKLNCYNFTISDLHAKNVMCYFWNETEGNRGATEIGSCVLHYLKALAENESIENKDVIFYSDNCCGQQKNKYLVAAYSYAVSKWNIRSITHKFLIHGHSQNEGDNVHSVIEKQIKRHLKSGPIYTPDQYSTLIRTARKNGPPIPCH